MDDARREVVLRKQRLVSNDAPGDDSSQEVFAAAGHTGSIIAKHPVASAAVAAGGFLLVRHAPARRLMFAALPILVRTAMTRGAVKLAGGALDSVRFGGANRDNKGSAVMQRGDALGDRGR